MGRGQDEREVFSEKWESQVDRSIERAGGGDEGGMTWQASDNPWLFNDGQQETKRPAEDEYIYVDLHLNPERFTGKDSAFSSSVFALCALSNMTPLSFNFACTRASNQKCAHRIQGGACKQNLESHLQSELLQRTHRGDHLPRGRLSRFDGEVHTLGRQNGLQGEGSLLPPHKRHAHQHHSPHRGRPSQSRLRCHPEPPKFKLELANHFGP